MKKAVYLLLAMVLIFQPGIFSANALATNDGGAMLQAGDPVDEAISTQVKTGPSEPPGQKGEDAVAGSSDEIPASFQAGGLQALLAGKIVIGPKFDPGLSSGGDTVPGSVSAGQAMTQFGPENNPLLPENLNPPESCGVPMRGPFGQDVEIFLGPWESTSRGFRVNQDPAWYGQETLLNAAPYSNLSAVPLGIERIAAVWKQGSSGGKLNYSIWDASIADGGSPGAWGMKSGEIINLNNPDGNPALIPLTDNSWEVITRQGGAIKYMDMEYSVISDTVFFDGWYSTNVTNTASDPAVISMDPHHTMVFYKDAEGRVWFTEWIGVWRDVPVSDRVNGTGNTALTSVRIGVWRDEPVPLIRQQAFIYLPIVTGGLPGGNGQTQAQNISDQPTGTPSDFKLASELSAISRQADHAAVFGVDAEGGLWVNEWTIQNATDWKDTIWVKLMDGMKVEKPAVASMHMNHLGVAVRTESGSPYYIEWTVASGWKEPEPLGDVFASPLSLEATSIDSLSVFGVKEDGNVYEKVRTQSNPWGNWQALTEAYNIVKGQTLVSVVRRMDDVMVIGRTSSGGAFSKHFTSQGQYLVQGTLMPSGIKGYPRGQALPWVDGTTLWADLHEDQGKNLWEMEVFDFNSSRSESLPLTSHPYSAQDLVSTAKGDLDFNGEDELVLATHSPGSNSAKISLLNFTVTPTLGIAISDTVNISDTVGDISLAVGDLDGDRVQNEVVVGTMGSNRIRLDILSYFTATQSLDLLPYTQYITYTAGISHELELATGYMYSELCADKMLVALVDTTKTSATKVSATVRTFCFNEVNPGNWKFEESTRYRSEVDGFNPELVFYHSDVDTSDLDVDGFDEVIYSYADKVIKYDPEYLPGNPFYPGVASLTLDQMVIERSLGVGDIDRDGVGEISLSYPGDVSSTLLVLEVAPNGGLMKAGGGTLPSGLGTVLMGDLDNDTYLSELMGCVTDHDPSVVAVVNGAPRWYENGVPIQDSFGSYSKSQSGGSGTETGQIHKLGGSITLGYQWEVTVPIIAVKLSKVRLTGTAEFLHIYGQRERVETINTSGSSWEFSGRELGLVVYNDIIYTCYFFTIYPPKAPQNSSLIMSCQPTPVHGTYIKTIDQWNSEEWKASAKSSWVDVGHKSRTGQHTNDISIPGNYPRQLPVDRLTLLLEWSMDGLEVGSSSLATNAPEALKVTWWEEQMSKTTTLNINEYNNNYTVALWAEIGPVGLVGAVSGTYGWTGVANTVTIIGSMLKIGGGVNYFTGSRPCYKIVPYVYRAKARTLAGTMVNYLEADYYMPQSPYACTVTGEQSSQDMLTPR
jgi:hypothetical protein